MNDKSIIPSLDLERNRIAEQLPEYVSSPIADVVLKNRGMITVLLGA